MPAADSPRYALLRRAAAWFNRLVKQRSLEAEQARSLATARETIAGIYREILKREPDGTGLDAWSRQLATGAITAQAVREQFRKSPEYLQRVMADGALQVPMEFPTIMDAIRAAPIGGKVSVAAGLYQEPIILDKRVDLIGEGRDLVEIRVPPYETALTIKGVQGSSISGFTFSHASKIDREQRVAAVLLENSTVRFQENRVKGATGYGVWIRNGGSSVVSLK